MESIYLDYNATTPMLPEVARAMARCIAADMVNPASQHRPGRQARRALEDAREGVGHLLGANLASQQADRVIFTSGGTEANNLMLLGMAGDTPGELVTSTIEHASIAESANELERRGWTVHRVGVDSDGVVDMDELRDRINSNTRLVTIMHANNETGVVQPIAQIAQICAEAGVPMHTDAAQTVGKISVNLHQLGVSALTVAAHKFHGPLGIGALVVRHGLSLQPIFFGGFQQEGLRPGTESPGLAVGLHQALQAFADDSGRTERMRSLRDRLEQQLAAGYPPLVVNGAGAERLPHTSNLGFVGLNRQALLMALDQAGVACSTGSACASGSSEMSPILSAMGLNQDILAGSLRLSLGATTTQEEIDEAARRILTVCAAQSG